MTRAIFDFNKYAGKEINILSEKRSWTSRRTGETHEYNDYRLDKNDPVIAEMLADIKAAGVNVRIWLPLSMGSMDYQPGRMNIHIEKNANGKWHINPELRPG